MPSPFWVLAAALKDDLILSFVAPPTPFPLTSPPLLHQALAKQWRLLGLNGDW